MICRHCGARIERGTMYDGNPPDGRTVYFADGPSRGCVHEPEDDRVGWRAELVTVRARPATLTYPTGSCGEYVEDE